MWQLQFKGAGGSRKATLKRLHVNNDLKAGREHQQREMQIQKPWGKSEPRGRLSWGESGMVKDEVKETERLGSFL